MSGLSLLGQNEEAEEQGFNTTPPIEHFSQFIENIEHEKKGDTNNEADKASDLDVSVRWSEFTQRWKYTIVAFYMLVVWPLGAVYFPRFIRATSSEFKPSVGTQSYEADQVYKGAYNTVDEHLPVVVLLEHHQPYKNYSNDTLVDGLSDLYKSTRDFVLNISNHLEELAKSYKHDDTYNKSSYAHISSYYSLENAGLYTLARHAFASKDGHMTFIRIEFATPSEATKRLFLDEIIFTCTKTFHPPMDVNVSFTGMHYFQQDMLDEIRADLKRMDFFSLPLALLVVAFVLRGGATGTNRLHVVSIIAIPLLTIISTTALAGALLLH
jgi:hypothetical protein